MSLCLNARANRLRVPLSLGLSSEIDLMAPRQVKRERFLLVFRGDELYWCPSRPVTESGEGYLGNVG